MAPCFILRIPSSLTHSDSLFSPIRVKGRLHFAWEGQDLQNTHSLIHTPKVHTEREPEEEEICSERKGREESKQGGGLMGRRLL